MDEDGVHGLRIEQRSVVVRVATVHRAFGALEGRPPHSEVEISASDVLLWI